MNREDRSEWFNRLKDEEQHSSKRVEEILKKQKEQARKRAGRRKVILASLAALLMIGAAVWGISQIGRLLFPGTGTGQAAGRENVGEAIQQPEETKTLETNALPAGNSAQVSANANAFYGNTVLSTAGGITVDVAQLSIPDWIQVNYLTVNAFSRPCIAMDSIQHIAIHYVGNAGTTASQNRSYFEGLKDTQITQASSHFIVGLEGEIIQCIPLNEMSYCTNERNVDTISIEVCHPDAGGQFTEVTYQSVVRLTAWLCQKFSLPIDSVIRHYDVTGKVCPKYYVEHPQAWDTLKADIQSYMDANPDIN